MCIEMKIVFKKLRKKMYPWHIMINNVNKVID